MDARPEDNGNYMASLVLRPLDIERGERVLYRLTERGRLLWELGINVGPRQMLDLAETLDYIDVTDQMDFYNALKCSLLSRHEQEPIFNQMFDYFWFRRDKQGKKDNAPGTVKREERQMRLPPSERKRLAEMRWNLGMRRTRRKAPVRSGSYPDMRRIVRRNLKYGAELLELTWRETKYKPRPLVIICDISGSMSLYSRLLLHFIHTISNG